METIANTEVVTENINEETTNPNTVPFKKILAVDEEGKKIKLTKTERKKLRVINKLLAGEINGTKAAAMLKVTTRQVRNLKRQVLDQGVYGIIHKNHYNKPYNTYEESLRKEIAHLYRTQYRGVNFSDFAKVVNEQGHDLSRSTVYNILRQQHIRSPQRKKKKRKKITDVTKPVTRKTTARKTSKNVKEKINE